MVGFTTDLRADNSVVLKHGKYCSVGQYNPDRESDMVMRDVGCKSVSLYLGRTAAYEQVFVRLRSFGPAFGYLVYGQP